MLVTVIIIIRIDCYIDNLDEMKKNYPEAVFISVMRNTGSVLAPSKELLIKAGVWKNEHGLYRKTINFKEYINLYIEEIVSKKYALKQMGKILEMSNEKNVFLVCKEKNFSRCHRSILKNIIEKRIFLCVICGKYFYSKFHSTVSCPKHREIYTRFRNRFIYRNKYYRECKTCGKGFITMYGQRKHCHKCRPTRIYYYKRDKSTKTDFNTLDNFIMERKYVDENLDEIMKRMNDIGLYVQKVRPDKFEK